MSAQQEALKTAATSIPSFYLLSEAEGFFTLKNDQILSVTSTYGSPTMHANVAFREIPVSSHITFCYCIYSPHLEGRSLKILSVVGERCCKSFSACGQCGITAEQTEIPNKV